jgi:hypothetical protein
MKTAYDMPELQIGLDKVCFVIFKANEFDAKDVASDEDSGSNPSDDGNLDVLEEHADDPVVAELTGFIQAMTDDEQIDLVTLMWLGRGDSTPADWQELRAEAIHAHNDRTAEYLLGSPLVGEYLEEGLSKLDLSCSDQDFR